MTYWRFYIDGALILDQQGNPEEPVSWDGIKFTLSRSKEYFGLENLYSVSVKFWNVPAIIVKGKYDAYGPDAQLTFLVQTSCDNIGFVTVIDGILNCANYSYTNGEVTVMMEDSSFNRLFKNRMDNVISLDSLVSTDGLPISDITSKEITLRSKAIVQYSELKANPVLLDINDTHSFSPATAFNAVFFPLKQSLIQDLKQTNELAPFFYFNQGPYATFAPPIFTNLTTSLISPIKIKYKLKGTFTNSCPDPVRYYYQLFFSSGSLASDNRVVLAGLPVTGTFVSGTGVTGFSFNLEGEIELPGSTPYVWLGITIFNYKNLNTASPSPSTFRLVTDASSFVSFNTESLFPDTKTRVFLLHEAFAKACEVITGVKDCFRSDYFGAGNSQPHQYDKTGCQRYTSVTNGLNIRNMRQKDESFYPINLSFSQLYKILDGIYCLGMGLEYDESDKKWFIRVEPRAYFFNREETKQFDDVSDIVVKASLDNFYNEVSAGYKKWQLNNGQTNGLDEFNTVRRYTILNQNSNKKLDIQSDAITGGYPIEFTRREQFNKDSTKDFETDNDLFIICLNRVPVTYGTTLYEVGSVNESNELFTEVANLISPETSYNLRITPARNVYRWSRFLKCSTHKKDNPTLKFTSGEGNFLMKTISINDCDTDCEIDEHADFSGSSNCFQNSGPQLLSPEQIEFEVPFDLFNFMSLMGNTRKSIRVNCSPQVSYRGFISEATFTPNQSEGGTVKFQLITVPTSGAAFDQGFDDGFDVLI